MYALALEMQVADPVRALDWRWKMATALHQCGVSAVEFEEDADVANALRLMEECEHRRQAGLPQVAAGRLASILGAGELCKAPAIVRAVVEAGILTGEPSECTAQRSNLSSGEVVDAYEALHFNVRDRRTARAWIWLSAIGPERATDTPEVRRLRLLKRLAFRGGPFVLDVSLHAFGLRQHVHSAGTDVVLEERLQRRVQVLEILEDPSLSLPVFLEICDDFRDLTEMHPFASRAPSNSSRIVQELVRNGCLTPCSAETGPRIALHSSDSARAA